MGRAPWTAVDVLVRLAHEPAMGRLARIDMALGDVYAVLYLPGDIAPSVHHLAGLHDHDGLGLLERHVFARGLQEWLRPTRPGMRRPLFARVVCGEESCPTQAASESVDQDRSLGKADSVIHQGDQARAPPAGFGELSAL